MESYGFNQAPQTLARPVADRKPESYSTCRLYFVTKLSSLGDINVIADFARFSCPLFTNVLHYRDKHTTSASLTSAGPDKVLAILARDTQN
jgi:hypothetical protein